MTDQKILIPINVQSTFMSGEYDCSCTPERLFATAKRIKGLKATVMKDLGHFPMSENPDSFRKYLIPVLNEIASFG